MFFSIIVPVYNIASYLDECLDSILQQGFKDYELILIDDGSTDESGKIIDEYKLKYPNIIKVIHQTNSGLSFSRNKGIEEAQGEYIIFIDGDDYISEDCLTSFYTKLNERKVDVLITKITEFFPDEAIKYLDKDFDYNLLDKFNKDNVIDFAFNKAQSTWPAVKYIVNRKFMVTTGLKFKENLNHEDIDYTPRLFLFANSFAGVNSHWYNHRMLRVGSINTTPNVKKVLDVIRTLAYHIDNKMYDNLSLETKLTIFYRLNRSLYTSIGKYHLFDRESKKQIINELRNNKHIFKYSKKTNHKLFNLVSKIFGLRIAFSLTRFM